MTTKTSGRPRQFDENDALLAAMKVFWKLGYDGASVKDLTDAMGINSPSLYAVFKDKQTLFLRAVEFYVNKDACHPLVQFETEPDIQQAIRKFLIAVIDHSTDLVNGAKGCFMSSCVATTAGRVPGVDALLQQAVIETDARLTRRFEAEKTNGTLPHDFPSQERARLMFDLRQGIVFRARSGFSAESMREDIDYRVQIILA